MPELRVLDLTKRYGGVMPLDGVSLSVERAERRAIIGPNGAGKSTLFGIVSGLLRPTRGDVEIHGGRTTGIPAESVARLGVARTFQMSSLFTESSALENVMVGALPAAGHTWNVVRPMADLDDCERAARAALAG